jgi:hypothetical protein
MVTAISSAVSCGACDSGTENVSPRIASPAATPKSSHCVPCAADRRRGAKRPRLLPLILNSCIVDGPLAFAGEGVFHRHYVNNQAPSEIGCSKVSVNRTEAPERLLRLPSRPRCGPLLLAGLCRPTLLKPPVASFARPRGCEMSLLSAASTFTPRRRRGSRGPCIRPRDE